MTFRDESVVFRFASFELDPAGLELCKSGVRVRLGGKPMKALTLLLEQAGNVVSREELQRRLWGDDTFVDFEDSLNHAIRRLREALDDDPKTPRFVETVAGEGYRFVANVEVVRRTNKPDHGTSTAIRRGHQVPGDSAQTPRSIETLPRKGHRYVSPAGGVIEANQEGIPSIAVLPFENRSYGDQDEYFSDGISEDITGALAKVDGLDVTPRSLAFQFKGKRPLPDEVGQALNVAYVIEGSVRLSENRVRLHVELIAIDGQFQVWSERYDRVIDDIFEVQDDISQAIARALKAKFSSITPALDRVRQTDNLDAYRLYLKGRQSCVIPSESGLRHAISCFEEALEHDPEYLEPHAGLADAFSALGATGQLRSSDAFPKAKKEALWVLDRNENLAVAHASLARVLYHHDLDFASAERSFQRALELDPGAPICRSVFGHFLCSSGRFSEGVAQCRTAVELDPMGPSINRMLALALLFRRDYEGALEQVRKTLDIAPSYYPIRWVEANVFYLLGRQDEALQSAEMARASAPHDPITLSRLSFHQAAAERAEDALGTLEKLKAMRSKKYVGALLISWPYVALGDMDSAFQWLGTALEEQDGLRVLLRHFPPFEGYAKDQRYPAIIRRIGFLN